MIQDMKADVQQYLLDYRKRPFFKKIFYTSFRQELWAILAYRFGHYAHCHCKQSLLKTLFNALYFFLRKFTEIISGVYIWPEYEIGAGLKIEHPGGVYIGANLGKNCRISQMVVIGHIGGFKGGGVPTLGDNVYVGAGAKILGSITIGSGAFIGANAVVLTNIPSQTVAVGVPARVVKSRTTPPLNSN